MLTSTAVFALLALVIPSLAAVTPTSPDSTTVVKIGDTLTALWDKDTTGTWTDLEIQLMTGPNEAMVPLSILASGLDGTSLTSYSTPVPNVSPNSAIYFLQLTLGGDVSTSTWTTRFTIAGADGSTSQPTNTSVYRGNTVQWGTGELLDASSTNSTTSSASTSASAVVAAVSTTSSTSSSASGMTIYTTLSSSTASASASGSVSASASASAAASLAKGSKASALASGAGRSVQFSFGGVIVGGLLGLLLV